MERTHNLIVFKIVYNKLFNIKIIQIGTTVH